MTKIRGIVTVGLAVILLAAFAALVWPTSYRSIPLEARNTRVLAAREHRLTGRVEFLTRDGWRQVPADTVDPLAARMTRLAPRVDSTP